MTAANPTIRFRKSRPCPICGGGDDMPRGQGRRCSGYLSSDGRFAYCTREEHAGLAVLEQTDPPSYRHILEGDCRCGTVHAPAQPVEQIAYDYRDAAGNVVYQVVRQPGKKFLQRRPAPDGSWLWNLEGVTRVLYRLPEVLAAAAKGETVYVVEGEKDVHAVERAGGVATCNPGGAGKWKPQYGHALTGASVVIVADKDEPGLAHARQIALGLPDAIVVQAKAGKDAADHLAAGLPLGEFQPLLIDPDDRAPEPPINLTDVGNGERLIARHGENLLYLDLWNKWMYWEGHCWVVDNSRRVEAWMKETIKTLAKEAVQTADDKERKRIMRHALTSEGAGRVRGALEMARSEQGVPVQPEDLDSDPLLLNLRNCTYDLAAELPRKHRREDLLTKVAPVDYEENATAPLWTAFLERILPDLEVRRYLQQLVGYSLTAKTGEQILPILYGSGANGKTTFLETIRAMLGDYGQVAPASVLVEQKEGIPNDVARLRGARFVMVSEIKEGKRLNEELVKRLTGGNTLTARFLRAEFFEFKPHFKAWLDTNYKPEIRGTDEGIWRRLRLIPFTEYIGEEERDEDFGDKLLAELPGVLNWALAGYMDYASNRLTTPQSVRAATTEYRAESDPITPFLVDCTVEVVGGWVRNGELYDAYAAWAKQNAGDPMSPKAFSQRMQEHGYQPHRTKTARTWLEIELQENQGNKPKQGDR